MPCGDTDAERAARDRPDAPPISPALEKRVPSVDARTDGDAAMHVIDRTADLAAATASVAQQVARRAAQELDEFRRYDYSAGWDSDDADLGWVDEEIVGTRRRLH